MKIQIPRKNAEAILRPFPKTRPPLSDRHRSVYEKEYSLNRKGRSRVTRISSWLEKWMHRTIAERSLPSETVLEIGAGTLNHIPYISENALYYDIVEPFRQLLEGSPHREKVRKTFSDIDEVQGSHSYDRIFSIAVLEHVEDLPRVVARSALLLRDGGVFQAGIPSEGEFLWGLAWRLTTGIAYRLRTKLPYGVLMRHEHVNTAREIQDVCRLFFKNVHVARFPFPFRPLSFYTVLECHDPRVEQARQYLQEGRVANG